MCGIAGFFEPRASGPRDTLLRDVRRMSAELRHRGPDADGEWVDEGCGIAFGHRRLSIVDLSPAGAQPMISRDGRFVLIYNGEVYNFAELGRELEAKGVRFRGHCDTEVIVEGFACWGIEATVRRLLGMFAFAVWDRSSRALTLGRDRMGIKPLYHGRAGSTWLFGSELKALRAHPAFRAEIDCGALAAYTRFNYVPAPASIYRGVHKLEPGCLLELRGSGEPRVTRYWDLREVAIQAQADRLAVSEEEAVEELERLLRDAVSRHMVADVPLGAFLSGGIDSSTVAALMQASSDRPVKTFSVGFPDPRYDEAPHARAVASHLRTDHTELYVEPAQALEVIPRLPGWFDEPFADSSQIPTYLVSELARRHVTVALSGDGGDELFGGYTRYQWGSAIRGYLARVPFPVRRLLGRLLDGIPAGAWGRLQPLIPQSLRPPSLPDRMGKLARVLKDVSPDAAYRQIVSLWDPELLVPGAQEPPSILLDASVARDIPDFVERMQFLDQLTYLPDDILVKVDRASMAVSLEARVPLLDHRVVELAWRLPPALKLAGSVTKRLLRCVLDRHVPRELVERPKMGFGVPLAEWLRGPLRPWAEELLSEERLSRDGHLRPGPIRALWADHLAGRRTRAYQLWGVLMLQAWLMAHSSRS